MSVSRVVLGGGKRFDVRLSRPSSGRMGTFLLHAAKREEGNKGARGVITATAYGITCHCLYNEEAACSKLTDVEECPKCGMRTCMKLCRGVCFFNGSSSFI